MNLDSSGHLVGLRKRAEFLHVQNHGRRHQGRYLLLMVQATQATQSRVGLTISKRVGNAVVRNKVRRRLREVIRARPGAFLAGRDHVFIARARAAFADVQTLHKEVEWLLNQVSFRQVSSPQASLRDGSQGSS